MLALDQRIRGQFIVLGGSGAAFDETLNVILSFYDSVHQSHFDYNVYV